MLSETSELTSLTIQDYKLEELQKLYGRAEDSVSRNTKPLILEKLNSKWRSIAEEVIRFVKTSYLKDQIPLSIRQVHYHLVHQPLDYRNDEKHSRELTEILLKARVAGLIGWEMISEEESTVYHYKPAGASPEEAIKTALETAKYATGKDPWREMGKYVLIISEKRELGPQLEVVAQKYFTRLVCTRGYGMWSRLYREATEISQAIKDGIQPYVLFVTDHDPSGLDLNRFAASILKNYWKLQIIDIRAMLKKQQVDQYNLPPAPTKVTDPRAKWYIKVFGQDCWEVDALGKELMQKLLSETLEQLIDWKIWNNVIQENLENMRKTEELAKQYLNKTN